MNYTVKKSKRKTLSLKVTKEGEIIVAAPLFLSDTEIEKFVLSHKRWIEKRLVDVAKLKDNALPPFTEDELEEITEKAKEIIPARAEYYAGILGVKYNKITIRKQRTRWGSCSGNKNLNFNCLLVLTPIEVLDSVIVHELCHLKEMNHSKRFYDEVLKAYPDYYKYHNFLKEKGQALINRLPK